MSEARPDRLALTAAPVFAGMALLTGAQGGGSSGAICLPGHGLSPLSGMVPMYLLMFVFHTGPWLKLISSRRRI